MDIGIPIKDLGPYDIEPLKTKIMGLPEDAWWGNQYRQLEYEVHQPLFDALTSDEPSTLYTLPLPPTGLSATKTIDGVLLSWNANNETDVTGYNIYRRDINDSEYELISENHNSTEYFDAVSADKSYYYKITAKDSQDTSYDSLVVIVSASN